MKTKTAKKVYKFFEYGAPAVESWKRLNCGNDYHCIEGKNPKGDWADSKKTICKRPAKNFHTDDYFSIFVEIHEGKPIVVGGGIAFEERKPSELIKELCPKCLAKAKKEACE